MGCYKKKRKAHEDDWHKSNTYKKSASFFCHFCDYTCRKGHRCRVYKQYAKRYGNKKSTANARAAMGREDNGF